MSQQPNPPKPQTPLTGSRPPVIPAAKQRPEDAADRAIRQAQAGMSYALGEKP